MAEYTPTTEQVREGYAWQQPGWRDGRKRGGRRAEFDAWLAEHDRAVRVEALREAADDLATGDFLLPAGHSRLSVAVDYLRVRADRTDAEC